MDRASPWNVKGYTMKKTLFTLVVPAIVIPLSFAGVKGYEPKVGKAAEAFALGAGLRYQYALDLLDGLAIESTGNNDPITLSYPHLSDDDKFRVTILVLVTNDLDGEHSFNFRQMIATDKEMLSRRIRSLKRKNVDAFLGVFDIPFESFADRCKRYLGVRPPSE